MPVFKPKNVLFCESAVPGLGGKFTLVNVVAGDLLPSGFPLLLQVAFYVELEAIKSPPSRIKLIIRIGDAISAIAEADLEENSKLGEPVAFATPTMALQVHGPGTITLEIEAEGFKTAKLMTKKILNPEPTE